MIAREIQDFIHLYSMVAFADGRKESGILVNKYNAVTGQVDFFFITHSNMQGYKAAFENYDREACSRLSEAINVDDICSIRPVTLSDYKIILQLLAEQRQKQHINN